MKHPLNVALIGYGYAGATFHAPLIKDVAGMTLSTIATSSPDKALRDFPLARVVAHPDDAINSPEVELVVLATPNTTHYPLARQALLANKHVVVEKPFTVTLAEAQDLVQLANDKQLLLSVFHNRRWDNDFLTVKRCIDSGVLGPIHTYEVHFDRYRPDVRARWREQNLPGSGSLYDLGSHLIDQALLLFGMPLSVSADLQKQRSGAEANDYFHLVLGYPERRVILHSSMLVGAPGPHFQLHGSLGSLIKYGMDPQEDALKQGVRPSGPLWGIEAPDQHAHLTRMQDGAACTLRIETVAGNYGAYYHAIHAALRGGGTVPVDAADALKVIAVIEAAVASHAQQRTVSLGV